jgi:serine/threonine protein kinase/DNA-binding CsgD family transcriptional regulator/tetratricopeptide (TPR) repeat protein
LDFIPRKIFQNYRIHRKIKEEKNSASYEGRHVFHAEERIFIKIIKNSRIQKSEIAFFKELETLSTLNHQNVTRILDFGKAQNYTYLITEYLDGNTLNHLVGKILFRDVIRTVTEIARGLREIHQRGLIHRRLSSKSVIVGKHETVPVKLVDFDSFGNLPEQTSYFYSYISPEQTGFLDRGFDHRSNLYSLGVIFYEMLTGQLPLEESNLEKLIHLHLAEKPVEPSLINSHIPWEIDRIVLKLLEKEPSSRFESAEDLLEALKPYLGEKKISPILSAPFQIPQFPLRRERELAVLSQQMEQLSQNSSCILIEGRKGSGKTHMIDYLRKHKWDQSPAFYYSAPGNGLITPLFSFFSDPYSGPRVFPHFSEINLDDREIRNKIRKFMQEFLRTGKKALIGIENVEHLSGQEWNFVSVLLQEILKFPGFLIVLTAGLESGNFGNHLEIVGNFSRLRLDLFQKKDIPEFVRGILGQERAFRAEFYNMLYYYSCGNPHYLIQILRNLFRDNFLYQQHQRWEVNYQSIRQFNQKTRHSGFVPQWLEIFENRKGLILKTAALFRASFRKEVLRFLLQYHDFLPQNGKKALPDEIEEVLEESLEEGILGRNRETGVYYFKDIHIKKAFARSLSPKERKKLFLRLAEKMEERSKAGKENKADSLLYYFEKAGEEKKAVFYAYLAYHNAVQKKDTGKGVFYLKKLVKRELLLERFSLKTLYKTLRLSRILHNFGRIEESIFYLRKLIQKMPEDHGRRGIVYYYLGRAYYFNNRISTAVRFFRKALKYVSDHSREKNQIDLYLAFCFFHAHRIEKSAEYLKNAEAGCTRENLALRISILGLKSWIFLAGGETEKASAAIEAMEGRIGEVRQAKLLTRIYGYSSVFYALSRRNPSKALEYSFWGTHFSGKSEYVPGVFFSHIGKAFSYMALADWEQLEKTVADIENYSRHGLKTGIPFVFQWLIESLIVRNRFGEALRKFREYQRKNPKIRDGLMSMVYHRVRGIYAYTHGNMEKAIRCFEKAYGFYIRNKTPLYGAIIVPFYFNLLSETGSRDRDLVRSHARELMSREETAVLYREQEGLFQRLKEIRDRKKTRSGILTGPTPLKEKIQLQSLIQIVQMMGSIQEFPSLLDGLLDKILEITGAERGGIWIHEKETGEFRFKTGKNIRGNEKFLLPVIHKVAENKNSFFLNSTELHTALAEELYYNAAIKSMVCWPLLIGLEMVGILYLDTHLIADLFKESELDFLEVLSTQIAVVIKNFQLRKKEPVSLVSENFCSRFDITRREKEIIQLLLERYSNKAIGQRLYISLKTVKNHVYHIYQKLGVNNRSELMLLLRDEILKVQ